MIQLVTRMKEGENVLTSQTAFLGAELPAELSFDLAAFSLASDEGDGEGATSLSQKEGIRRERNHSPFSAINGAKILASRALIRRLAVHTPALSNHSGALPASTSHRSSSF
jgi:hypothetical protein